MDISCEGNRKTRDFFNTLPVHHDHPPICHSSPKLWPTDCPPKSWAMMGWWESGGCGRSRRVTPPYLGQWSWVTSLTGHIYGSQRCYEFLPFAKAVHAYYIWLSKHAFGICSNDDVCLSHCKVSGAWQAIRLEKGLFFHLNMPHSNCCSCKLCHI